MLKILEVSKNTLEKFNEKFDWSARAAAPAATGYGQEAQTGAGQMTMETPAAEQPASTETTPAPETSATQEQAAPETPKQVFSFDDVNFD